MDLTKDLLTRSDRRSQMSDAVTSSLDELGDRLFELADARPEPAPSHGHVVPRVRRRRRRRRVLAGAAAVAILAIAAPAAANYVGLHTGHFGQDGRHYGEFLNLNAPDGMKLLRSFEHQYPLPRGGTWTAMEQRWQNGPGGEGQAGVFEEAVGGEAQCQWTRTWLDADAAGNSPAAERAARVLAQIPHWHVVTAYEDDTHGVANLARAVADAAAVGNRQPAQQYVVANCPGKAPGR